MQEQTEEFDRFEEAYDAMSDAVDDGSFQYGDIMIVVGIFIAELIKDSNIDSTEMFDIIKDVATTRLKQIADA